MFCENCGKSLIRGYQFCLECGTPVPPEDEESKPEIVEQESEQAEVSTGPRVEPLNGGDGTLVFCPNCGMRMQTSTTVCEKCGMQLNGGAPNGYAVPGASIGDEMASLSPSEIDSISSFGSDALGGGSLDEIEKLTAQLEKLGSTSSAMPAIGSPSHNVQPAPRKQPTLVPMGEPDPSFANSASNQSTNDVPEISPKPVRRDAKPSDSTLGEAVPVIEDISMNSGSGSSDALFETDPTRVMSFDIDKTPEVEMVDPTAEALSMPFDITPVEPIPEAEPVIPFYQQPDPAPVAEAPAEIFAQPVPAAETPAEPAEIFAQPAPAAEAPAESVPINEAAPADVDPAELFGNGQTEPERKPTSAIDSYEPERKPTSSIDSYTPAYNDPYDSPEWDIKPNKNYRPHDYVEEEEEKAQETEDATPPDLGKLVYCRNCGQDMYEKETFCKNCGSPNLWDKKPLKHQVSSGKGRTSAPAPKKEPIKIFGVIPLPTAVVAVVAIIGIIVLVATTNTSTQVPVSNTSKTTSSTTSAAPVESDTSSDNNAAGGDNTSSVPADTSADITEPTDTEPVETDPVETDPVETDPAQTDPVDSRPEETTPAESSSSHTTTTTKTTTKTTVTTKVTTTTTKINVVVPTATVKSQNADRDKILDAVEAMAGEIGKIQVLATSAIDAINEDSRAADTALTSYYNRDYASNLVSIVKSGKSGVDKAYSAAKPKNSVFNSAYKSLGSLYNAYKAYYDYVINPGKGSTYESKCNSLYSSFISAAKELKLTNLKTSDQTSSDENQMILDALSNAANAARNSANQYSSLRSKVAELKSSKYDTEVVALLNKSSNQKLYMNAAMYGEIAIVYNACIIDKAPSDSSRKSNLSVLASELENLFVEVENAEMNTLSGFKTNMQTSIDTVNSAAKKVG